MKSAREAELENFKKSAPAFPRAKIPQKNFVVPEENFGAVPEENFVPEPSFEAEFSSEDASAGTAKIALEKILESVPAKIKSAILEISQGEFFVGNATKIQVLREESSEGTSLGNDENSSENISEDENFDL